MPPMRNVPYSSRRDENRPTCLRSHCGRNKIYDITFAHKELIL